MMAVRLKMGFNVEELLQAEKLKDVKVISGERWLDREIKGVTIIEARQVYRWRRSASYKAVCVPVMYG